jgi:polyhydroxybutyrate depolymerase
MMKATLSCLAVSAVFAAAGCSIPAEEAGGGSGDAHATGGETGSGGTTATGGIIGSGGVTVTGGSGGTSDNAGTGGSTAGTGGNGGGAGGAGTVGMGGSDAGNGGADGGAALTTCTPARPHAGGTTTVQMQFGGMNRDYVLHIPPGYDGTKQLPLVFDVHGYTSFATEQLMRSKWDKMADKEGFVLIDPDGVNKSWNAGSCCGGNNQNDVAFFREMVKKATAELCIDSKRVYVSGHSNGGAMTYRLACEAADIFAAAAPVCGWMTVSTCNPARPIPVLAIRGLNDGTVKINTADADVDEWLSNDKCAKEQVSSSGVCKTYKSCEAGTQVMDCRPRGDHNFFYATNPDNYLVPDNAWPFFKQFSLP